MQSFGDHPISGMNKCYKKHGAVLVQWAQKERSQATRHTRGARIELLHDCEKEFTLDRQHEILAHGHGTVIVPS